MTKATLICDLQFGSTGKGLIAGYLAARQGYSVVVSANMPNAGHTYIDKFGNKIVFKVLPCGATSTAVTHVLIGPGAVFSPHQLKLEVEMLKEWRPDSPCQILIHPNSTPLRPEWASIEKGLVDKIGSTGQGSSIAMIRKINRDPDNVPISRGWDFDSEWIKVATHDEYNQILEYADKILIEGAQGFSLGVHTEFYPYCTSRSCTPAQILSDCGVPVDYLGQTIGTARTYPIRVGGNSGPCYPDQEELTWKDIGVKAELTTVTQRERRIFTFSQKQMFDAMWQCRPDVVFLNFCNYCKTTEEVRAIIELIEIHGSRIAEGVGHVGFLGFGARDDDIETREYNEGWEQ